MKFLTAVAVCILLIGCNGSTSGEVVIVDTSPPPVIEHWFMTVDVQVRSALTNEPLQGVWVNLSGNDGFDWVGFETRITDSNGIVFWTSEELDNFPGGTCFYDGFLGEPVNSPCFYDMMLEVFAPGLETVTVTTTADVVEPSIVLTVYMQPAF